MRSGDRDENEQENLRNITSNPEATMSKVASNSVAMAVLFLRDNYLGKTPSEEALQENYEWCLSTLRSLKVEDFFKSGEEKNEKNKPLLNELTSQLNSTIDFIIRKMDEPISALDRVTLYLPDEKENYREIKYELPLKFVLPLLVKAYYDDERFSHYDIGTAEERLQKAEEDRPRRLLSLFKCFQRTKKGICRQGIRNEIVMLLNGIYKGINLIEDTVATVEYYLKDHIFQTFWKKYSEVEDEKSDDQSKILQSALFTWMIEQDPTAILQIIDPEEQIKTNIKNCFIQNAINPAEIKVKYDNEKISFDMLIERCSKRLHFSTDSKHRTLSKINIILNADNNDEKYTARNIALKKIQLWIKNQLLLSSSKNDKQISEFYAVYHTEQQLRKHKGLLVISGTMTEEAIQTLLNECENYFKELAASNEFLSPPEEYLSKTEKIIKIITSSRENNSSDLISNYLNMWYGANPDQRGEDTDTLKRLYSMLIDEILSAKITFNDHAIKEYYTKIKNEGNSAFLDISPYEINRIFLHAILIKPEDWSPLFAYVFQETLSFVKGNFNQDNKGLVASLKQGSYPPQLLKQLNYLQERWHYAQSNHERKNENQSHICEPYRPSGMILLPERVRKADEWISISSLMDEDKKEEYYRILSAFLQPLLVQKMRAIRLDRRSRTVARDADKVLDSIPASHKLAFFVSLGIDEISNMISTDIAFITFIAILPKNDYKSFLEKLGHEKISSIICDFKKLENILSKLSLENRMELLVSIGIDKIVSLVSQSSQHLGILLSLIPLEQYKTFFEFLSYETISLLIENDANLIYCVNNLTEIQCQKLLELLGKETATSLIPSLKEKLYLRYCEGYTTEAFFEKMGVDLALELISTELQLRKILDMLPEQRSDAFLYALNIEKVRPIIESSSTLLYILKKYPVDQREAYLINLGYEKIKSLMTEHNQLYEILECLPELCRFTFITAIGRDKIVSLSSPYNIGSLTKTFKLLPNDQMKSFYDLFIIDDFVSSIKSAGQYQEFMEIIPDTLWETFREAFGVQRISGLIINISSLTRVMSTYSEDRRSAFLYSLDITTIFQLIKYTSDLIKLLTSLPMPERFQLLQKIGFQKVISLTQYIYNIESIMRLLQPTQYVLFLERTEVKNSYTQYDLFLLLKSISLDERIPVINNWGYNNLQTLITEARRFSNILELLPESKCRNFLIDFGVKNIISLAWKCNWNLSSLLGSLSDDEKTFFYEHSMKFSDLSSLGKILDILPHERRKYFLINMENEIKDIISNDKAFDELSSYIHKSRLETISFLICSQYSIVRNIDLELIWKGSQPAGDSRLFVNTSNSSALECYKSARSESDFKTRHTILYAFVNDQKNMQDKFCIDLISKSTKIFGKNIFQVGEDKFEINQTIGLSNKV